jgi:MFS family permease
VAAFFEPGTLSEPDGERLPAGPLREFDRGLFAACDAGAFSAGVLPVVLAWIGDTSPDMLRARHYALASMASLLGFLVGPMLGQR